MTPFKTFSGAASRARSETAFANGKAKFCVVANTNSHQVAQGFVWRVKRLTKAELAARAR